MKEKKEETEKIIEDIKNAEKYSWVVQPEIEADEIYYLSGYNSKDVCKNTECKQMISDYAVIRKGDTYGLINSDGKWYKDLECTNITTVIGYYELQTKETMYSAELDTDTNDFGYVLMKMMNCGQMLLWLEIFMARRESIITVAVCITGWKLA